MSDFFQNGIVTTLHDVGHRSSSDLEDEVARYAKLNPVALVLPCLASEMEHDALDLIVRTLKGIPYISRVIVGLDRADRTSFEKSLGYFSRLPQPHEIIWNDGPNLSALLDELRRDGLAPLERGKGHNLWTSLGVLQARGFDGIVAIHDCDIVNYSSRLLARLVYPLVRPDTQYAYAKAYYARVSQNRLYGRVSRLFVTPLVRALKHTCGPVRYLEFLDSFRYPLAGECAMRADVARGLNLTANWGLEIGMLTEIYKTYSTRQICQVDVADTYDHKHQLAGSGSPAAGLNKMCYDIALCIFQGLSAHGHALVPAQIDEVVSAYRRIVLDHIDTYSAVAAINGLSMSPDEETSAASGFAEALHAAAMQFVSADRRVPVAPGWDAIARLRPEIFKRLHAAVALDSGRQAFA